METITYPYAVKLDGVYYEPNTPIVVGRQDEPKVEEPKAEAKPKPGRPRKK